MKLNTLPLLAVDLDASAFAAEDRGAGAGAGTGPAAWLDLVLALERAGVTLVTLSDTFHGEDGVARLDPVMRAAWLAARSTSIGVLAAADTTVTEPYLLGVQIATIDFVSHGRAGWIVQISGRAADVGYVGPRPVAAGPLARDEAGEFVTAVRQLWDSWEDDAEIRDVATQRFIDRDRIHHIDYTGTFLSVKGPSIAPRSPQGQPPVAFAVRHGGDANVMAFGLAHADVLFLGSGFNADGVRGAAAELNRSVRLFADVPVAEASVGRVGELLSDGFHGVRLIPSSLPGDLPAMLDLIGALGLGGGGAGAGAGPGAAPAVGTLRETLSLRRPENRFAGVRS